MEPLERLLGAFLFFVIFGLMFLILISFGVERATGAETSKKFNTYGLIGIVLFGLLGLILNFFVPLSSLIPTTLNLLRFVSAAAIAGGLGYIILRRRKEKASPDLITTGKYVSQGRLILGTICGLNALCKLAGLSNTNDYIQVISDSLFWGIIAAAWTISSNERIYVLKNGVSKFSLGGMGWERFSSYLWDGRIPNRLFLFFKGGGRMEFTIPKEHKEQLDNFLNNSQLTNHTDPAPIKGNLSNR